MKVQKTVKGYKHHEHFENPQTPCQKHRQSINAWSLPVLHSCGPDATTPLNAASIPPRSPKNNIRTHGLLPKQQTTSRKPHTAAKVAIFEYHAPNVYLNLPLTSKCEHYSYSMRLEAQNQSLYPARRPRKVATQGWSHSGNSSLRLIHPELSRPT